jgi:hypothetical protein
VWWLASIIGLEQELLLHIDILRARENSLPPVPVDIFLERDTVSHDED